METNKTNKQEKTYSCKCNGEDKKCLRCNGTGEIKYIDVDLPF